MNSYKKLIFVALFVYANIGKFGNAKIAFVCSYFRNGWNNKKFCRIKPRNVTISLNTPHDVFNS